METTSSPLTDVERELVALGAALASNCVPCIEHHIPAAREAGLDDRRIRAALLLADTVRQVPAAKVLATAMGMLPSGPRADSGAAVESPCARTGSDARPERPCCA